MCKGLVSLSLHRGVPARRGLLHPQTEHPQSTFLPVGMSSQSKAPVTRLKSAKLGSKKRPRKEVRPASAVGERLLSKRNTEANASCDSLDATTSELREAIHQRREQQYRPLCGGEYVHKYLCRVYDATMGKSRRQVKFPFMELPVDCMLKIFSFLTPKERGLVARTCSKWHQLMRQSTLWNIVDLTAFPLCPIQKQSHVCGADCYMNYKTRVKKFMRYLQGVKPVIRRLRFAFDIYDPEDQWLESVEGLIEAAHCQDLSFAHVNWKETPIKPFWVEQIAWSVNDYNEFMHRHRHRQRRFIQFFDLLTKVAPNITKMVLPFDWSVKSLEFLGRLQSLNTLVLEKYFVFQTMSQASLEQLFEQLPCLERLILEVWTPSGKGLTLYHIQSPILIYLDVSHCRGFYLGSVTLPNLKVFKVTRHPWNGPLTCADSINVICIYEVLKAGAPNLQQLNEHTLQESWKDIVYPELQTVLQAVCSCRRHKTGWAM